MVSVKSSRASKGFRKAASLKETTSWKPELETGEPEDEELKKRCEDWQLQWNIECMLMHVAKFCLTKCYAIRDASIFLLFTQDIQVGSSVLV